MYYSGSSANEKTKAVEEWDFWSSAGGIEHYYLYHNGSCANQRNGSGGISPLEFGGRDRAVLLVLQRLMCKPEKQQRKKRREKERSGLHLRNLATPTPKCWGKAFLFL